jgi:hypothetical protein
MFTMGSFMVYCAELVFRGPPVTIGEFINHSFNLAHSFNFARRKKEFCDCRHAPRGIGAVKSPFCRDAWLSLAFVGAGMVLLHRCALESRWALPHDRSHDDPGERSQDDIGGKDTRQKQRPTQIAPGSGRGQRGGYAATCLLSCPADTVPEIRKPIHIKATKLRGCGQDLPSGHRPVQLRTGGVG